MKNALIVFIKAPIEGEVKTRLAESIGDEKAVKVYKALLEQTYVISNNFYWDTFFYTNKEFLFKNEKLKLQKGDDLGLKISNAFKEVFTKGYDNVCIIGSDCFELKTRDIIKAFNELNTHQNIIGKSEDGGYYLLGTNTFGPELFTDIKWSTPEVYRSTINKFKELKTSYQTLRTLNDIDNLDDLKEHEELIELLK